jgi:threonine/homoserine/homoserine lactone efflux protein
MFETSQLLMYTMAAFLLVITPGPDMMYVLTVSLARGTRAGVLSAVGVSGGVLIHTLMVSLGLAVLLQTSELAYNVVKYAGGMYLIYLGVEALRHGSSFHVGATSTGTVTVHPRQYFLRGMMSNVLNPKVALFFLTFLPQFVTTTGNTATAQMVTLGLIYAVIAICVKSSLALMSGTVSVWLRESPHIADWLNWFMAAVFLYLGIRLLLPDVML